jgi:hypothetical protein
MQTQYNNKGVLFPNKRKQGNQPDWTGKLTIDGKEDRLSGWIKEDKNGQTFISLARTPADQVDAFRKSNGAQASEGPSFGGGNNASANNERKADNDQIPF